MEKKKILGGTPMHHIVASVICFTSGRTWNCSACVLVSGASEQITTITTPRAFGLAKYSGLFVFG